MDPKEDPSQAFSTDTMESGVPENPRPQGSLASEGQIGRQACYCPPALTLSLPQAAEEEVEGECFERGSISVVSQQPEFKGWTGQPGPLP